MILNATASGDNVVVPKRPGYEIWVYGMAAMAGSAVSFKFKSDTTDISGLFLPAANGGAVLPVIPRYQTETQRVEPWLKTLPGEALVMNNSTAVAVSGIIVAEYIKAHP